MNLPIYQLVRVESTQLDDVVALLNPEMNLHRPVALILKHLSPELQREVTGLIENWFAENHVSWRFPYPVYLVADHGEGLGNLPVADDVARLPRFYNQKDQRATMKEVALLARSGNLRQEIRNADTVLADETIHKFGEAHRRLRTLAHEGEFLQLVLRLLKKRTAPHGPQKS